MKKLNLGCGPNLLEGWVNADLYPANQDVFRMDATRPFPFADGSFDRIFTEHMIEHVKPAEGAFMLAECYRILAPGGRIRVSTPGLEFLYGLMYQPTRLSDMYVEWACRVFSLGEPICAETVINNFVRAWGHQYIYSRDRLCWALSHAGFRRPVGRKIGESEDPTFTGLENAERMPEGFLQLETMTIEAER